MTLDEIFSANPRQTGENSGDYEARISGIFNTQTATPSTPITQAPVAPATPTTQAIQAAPTTPTVQANTGMIGLRDAATQAGGQVGWDATNGVTINGMPINTAGLTNYEGNAPAGYQNNTYYGSQEQIDQLLSPYVYQNPYSEQEQSALDAYQQWASQPYNSQYAPQIEALVKNILARQFNYDPANDKQFQLASKELTRNVMETMNSRGILNSTVTENQVQQGVADLLPQYQQIARQAFQDEGNMLMSQVDMLMGIDETQYNRYQDEGERYAKVLDAVMAMDNNQYKKWQDAYTNRYNAQRDSVRDAEAKVEVERTKISDAWDRTSELGYVDNASSITLGVPAGTLSKEAREAKEAAAERLAEQKQSLANQLAIINAQYQKEVKVAALKEESTADPSKLGTEQQVSQYYQLKDIYFGGGNGAYANDPLKAYNWLMAHSKDNIALIGDKLYNKLLTELSSSMKTQKSYGVDTPAIPEKVKPFYDRAVSMMKEKIGDEPRYTVDDIFNYVDMQNLEPDEKDALADLLGLPK